MGENVCPNCKNPVSTDALFCGVCGTKLAVVPQTVAQPTQVASQQRYPQLFSELDSLIEDAAKKRPGSFLPGSQLEEIYKDLKKEREPKFSAAIQILDHSLPKGSGPRLISMLNKADIYSENHKEAVYTVLMKMDDPQLFQAITLDDSVSPNTDGFFQSLVLAGQSDDVTIKWLGKQSGDRSGSYLPLALLSRINKPQVIDALLEGSSFSYDPERDSRSSNRFARAIFSSGRPGFLRSANRVMGVVGTVAKAVALSKDIANAGSLAALPYVPIEMLENTLTGLASTCMTQRYRLDLIMKLLAQYPQTSLNKFWPADKINNDHKRYVTMAAILLARGESNRITDEVYNYYQARPVNAGLDPVGIFLLVYALVRYRRMLTDRRWNDFLMGLTLRKEEFIARSTKDLIVVYDYPPLINQVVADKKYDASALVYSAVFNKNPANAAIFNAAQKKEDRESLDGWKQDFQSWGYV